MYVDFKYYKEEYKGKLDQATFDQQERQAEAYIRYLTMRQELPDLDAVRDAVCSVADVYAAVYPGDGAAEGAVKSENNDGYSVTYVTDRADGETLEAYAARKAYEAARIYLLPTGLLNRSARMRNYDYQCRYYNL